MSDEVQVEPYRPFPSFAEWAQTGYESSLFARFADEFERARASAQPDVLRRVLDKAAKWAAIDTGAIEGLYEVERGFTFSVAASAAAWDRIHEIKGDFAARTIKDALDAFEYVLDAATQSIPITEHWIRQLHSTACRSQDTYTVATAAGPQEQELPKGAYKTHPNSPLNFATNTIHSYAPPDDTSPEMHRLVTEFDSSGFQNSHPVLQASYAHYAFVCIHPFADGNGRVSRALASVFSYRSPGVPLVIFVDQKPAYLDALEQADIGNSAPFIRFVAERMIDTMNTIREEVENDPGVDIASQLAAIQDLYIGRAGLTHAEVDSTALRLFEAIEKAYKDQAQQSGIAAPLSASISRATGYSFALDGYRPLPGLMSLQVLISSAPPAQAQSSIRLSVLVARPENTDADFAVLVDGRLSMRVFLREVHPIIQEQLQYRIGNLASSELSKILAAVMREGRDSLRNAGY